jgi:phage regulator Rha-like protein
MSDKDELLLAVERIENRIILIRGHKVLLDSDLAALYGVPIKRLNEQVRRNQQRFPADFMFRIEPQEWDALRSHNATLKTGRGQHRKYPPYAFTEHGALMAANVLSSARAIEASLYVVRAFVRLREVLATHAELAKQLAQLEKKTEALSLKHDSLAANTRAQFKEVIAALRELMRAPETKKRPIGFVTPKEK